VKGGGWTLTRIGRAPFSLDTDEMRTEEAPTKRDLRRIPDQAFGEDEAKTKPAVAPVRPPATERPEFDFSRDPRRDPE
jgi:hypothetical protein